MENYTVLAPTRVDLAGGTLDLWPLCSLLEETKTINIAIDLFAKTHFEISESDQFSFELLTPQNPPFTFYAPMTRAESKTLFPSLRFPVYLISHFLRESRELPRKQFRVQIDTQAPMGSGLGGSSALCVSLTFGLARYFNRFIEQGWQWSMLEWVKDIEASFLEVPTGFQDYLASLFGGLHCYHFAIGKKSKTPYSKSAFDELSKRMLVIDSGEMHESGLSNWEIFKEAIEKSSDVLRGLWELKSLTQELDQLLRVDEIRWNEVGGLLNEEWKIRKTLFKVDTKKLRDLLKLVKGFDILGAKVCGAASGGCLIVLVEPDRIMSVTEACRKEKINILNTRPTLTPVSVA